jgi:hypothetical protein
MYLGYQNGKIKFYTEQPLDKAFYNLDKVEETELEYVLDGKEYVLKDEAWEEKQSLIEKERIQELSMTRSDFFDGTIMAWGIGQDELLVLIQGLLATLPIEDVKKLIAINNFKNALNFYRKHDLFKMLVNIPIQLTETIQIILTEESLDKFFDEVDKGNKATAWQYLPKPELIPVEEEIIPEPPVDNSEPVEEQEPVVDDIPDGEDVNKEIKDR